MATTFDWASPGTYSAGNLISGNGTSGDLKNLASTSVAQGAAVDNSGGPILAGVELKVRLQSSATGNPYVKVWFVHSLDGTNYEDGSTSGAPVRPPDLVIPVSTGVSTQQRIIVGPVLLPNGKFKATLQNQTGQAMTNTTDENQLSYVSWKDEGS